MPDGWFVESATIGKYESGPITNVLFAPGGRVTPGGPMLLIGEVASDDRMALGSAGGREDPRLPGPVQGNTLAHLGAFTVANWDLDLRDGFESPYVVSRGLSETEVADVAHALSFDPRPSLAADALPSGWSLVASAPQLPRQRLDAPEHIRLVNTDGSARVDVLAYRLDEPAATIDAIVAELQRAAGYSFSAAREVGTKTVLAFAYGDGVDVDLLARSMRPVTSEQWVAFQREAFEAPPSALCRDPLRNSAIIEAVYDEVRVVIAVPRAGTVSSSCIARVIVGEGFDGASAGPDSPGGASTGVTITVGTDESGDEHWCVYGGTVPSGTARVVVESPGERAVDARIVDLAGDESRRYYGAYLDRLQPRLCTPTVIAYDSDGTELARQDGSRGP